MRPNIEQTASEQLIKVNSEKFCKNVPVIIHVLKQENM